MSEYAVSDEDMYDGMSDYSEVAVAAPKPKTTAKANKSVSA
jgi:hypothetical protein